MRSIWDAWRKGRSAQPQNVTIASRAITEPLEGRTLFSTASDLAAVIAADKKADVDDRIAGAAKITVGMHVDAKIGYEMDVDLYRFKANAGDRLMFDIDLPTLSMLDSELRLFDVTGKEIASSDDDMGPDDPAGGMESFIDYTFRTTNTYYIGVSGAPNDHYNILNGKNDVLGSMGKYTLNFTKFIDPLDDNNDQIGEAEELALNTRITANISSATDVDMFKVTVKAGQTIGFDLNLEPGSTLESVLRVFDGQGRQLAADQGSSSPSQIPVVGESYVEYKFTQAGTYFVAVSSANNNNYDAVTGLNDVGGSSIGKYSLKAKLIPSVLV